jgi:hypothetical protein
MVRWKAKSWDAMRLADLTVETSDFWIASWRELKSCDESIAINRSPKKRQGDEVVGAAIDSEKYGSNKEVLIDKKLLISSRMKF